jgi:acyl dehydratase
MQGLVGRQLGPTGWRQITQADIDAFAAITHDRQWIHVDVERARSEGPFGTTIAHGTLLLALIDGFRDELTDGHDAPLAVAAGWDRVRYPSPVTAGSHVRARMEITAAAEVARGWRIVERWTVMIRDADRPACVADAIGLVLGRGELG